MADTGCSVTLEASPVDAFDVQETMRKALDALFDPKTDGVLLANKQLSLAKSKGAKRAILLLDCYLLWRPNAIKAHLNGKESRLLSGLDSIYLVKASQKRVTRVWPSAEQLNPKH
jgi:hypothetical protein